MLKNHQPSQLSLGIIGVRLCALFVLLSVTACQSIGYEECSLLLPALTAPTPFESQPIADGPVLLRTDLTLRKVLEVGASNIRLVTQPC